MIETEMYLTMTELGRRYGASAHKVGKILKDWGYRDLQGMPTPLAQDDGMVEQRAVEDRPWVSHWAWHFAKTSEILEFAGLTQVDSK